MLSQVSRRAIHILAGLDLERDRLLATYPRSGNTWMRAVLSDAILPNGVSTFHDFECAVFSQHASSAKMVLSQRLGIYPPRLAVKSHSLGRWDLRYRAVLCIVRDPRDIIPSFHRQQMRDSLIQTDLPSFAEAAIKGAVGSGTWYDHLRSWQYVAQSQPNVVNFIRYRDLRRLDPATISVVARVFDLSEERLTASFTKLDLSEMRRIEMQSFKPGQDKRKDSNPFIGQGKASSNDWELVDGLLRRHAPHWFDLIEEMA